MQQIAQFNQYYYTQRYNNDIGGSFFKYLAKRDAPRRLIQYLNRLQIFDRFYGVDFPHLYEKALLNEISYKTNEIFSYMSYEVMIGDMNENDVVEFHNADFKTMFKPQKVNNQRSELNELFHLCITTYRGIQ